MQIKKEITNPHVLAKAIEKRFGAWPSMATCKGEVTIKPIADIKDDDILKFIIDWAETRTDDEEIAEEQERQEEEKFLKVLAKVIKKDAKTSLLTTEASAKIDIIEGKKANGKSSGNADSN